MPNIMTYTDLGVPDCTTDLCDAIEASGCLPEAATEIHTTSHTVEGFTLKIGTNTGTVHSLELPFCDWVDQCLAAKPECVDVVVNTPPTAIITGVTTTAVSSTVTLDGATSFDPEDGTVTTYTWSQVSGVTVAISGGNTSAITYTSPGTVETLVFELCVTDVQGLSHCTQHTVTTELAQACDSEGGITYSVGGGTETVTWDASATQLVDPMNIGGFGTDCNFNPFTNDNYHNKVIFTGALSSGGSITATMTIVEPNLVDDTSLFVNGCPVGWFGAVPEIFGTSEDWVEPFFSYKHNIRSIFENIPVHIQVVFDTVINGSITLSLYDVDPQDTLVFPVPPDTLTAIGNNVNTMATWNNLNSDTIDFSWTRADGYSLSSYGLTGTSEIGLAGVENGTYCCKDGVITYKDKDGNNLDASSVIETIAC